MRQLLYVSNTTRDFSRDELSNILTASRFSNAAADVTGMLLYLDGGFLQVLEGEHSVIQALYDRIAQDKRHWNTAVLLDREAPRAFKNWSMGFKAVTEADGAAFEITNEAINAHKVPMELMVMLKTFYSVQS